mmetsp:Transcript_27314/g.88144  ORF Transcript_27314/g.88144 Transcript_27314/m.88144 type:complete len:235 (+) Transcript_27314:595-1299(+)
MMKALQETEEHFEKGGYALLLLEPPVPMSFFEQGNHMRPLPADRMPVLTPSALLQKDHLLLPLEAFKKAAEIELSLKKALHPTEDAEPQAAALWKEHLRPLLLRSTMHIIQANFKACLGELYGLLMFAKSEDNWFMHEEVYMRWKEFCDFWKVLGKAWQLLLGRSDADLGLAPEIGRAGGYRARLEQMLKEFQTEMNEYLRLLDQFDQEALEIPMRDGPMLSRLNIIDTPIEEK